jgi:hypothetical protein
MEREEEMVAGANPRRARVWRKHAFLFVHTARITNREACATRLLSPVVSFLAPISARSGGNLAA